MSFNRLFFAALALTGLLIGSCKNSTEVKTIISQIMFVYAEYDSTYWDDAKDERIVANNTEIFGVCFASPLPAFEYIKAGNKTFSGKGYSLYNPGYLQFGVNEDYDPIRLFSALDPLTVEVKTSQGKLKGKIDLPDFISGISLSVYDTLHLGESFTVSWQSGGADFYSVYMDYEYKDESDNWQYVDLDTFVTANSVTFAGSVFKYNGEIEYIRVQPVNGPFPKDGSAGNMDGEGDGFLYYFRNSTRYDGDDVIVGSGVSYKRVKSQNEQLIKKKLQQKLESLVRSARL